MCYLTTPQGELVTSMMLTDVGKKTDILVTGFNRIGCYVKMLVVGGGGQDGGPTKFGGAGSGNLQYLDAIPIETGTHIRAQVCSWLNIAFIASVHNFFPNALELLVRHLHCKTSHWHH